MVVLGYTEILIALLCFLILCHLRRNINSPLTDWPFLGMLPQILLNLWQFHDYVTHVLNQNGGTAEFKGPWFANMNYLVTSDSMNVNHILSNKFDNYIKGPEFREIFEGLGIITMDSECWRTNRAALNSLIRRKNFKLSLEGITQNKVQNYLLPILHHHAKNQGMVLDLQAVFHRFTFDNICYLVLGYDPKSLSTCFPKVTPMEAFDQIMKATFHRHLQPRTLRKLQKWLQVGNEKQISEASRVFEKFLYECIESKRKGLLIRSGNNDLEEMHVDCITTLIKEQEEEGKPVEAKFLRDAAFSLVLGGRSTITSGLTWFFWLVSTNPLVEAKIIEEMKMIFLTKGERKNVSSLEVVSNLVYLHAAICEALRLFPPIPWERKKAVGFDVLPSGHRINPNTEVLYFLYSMGRSEKVWGKDCLDFKPERWISERGGLVHVPSYKFIAFNAGPRNCLGKDMALMEMKMVASAILWNYRFEVVEGHHIVPTLSIDLLMEHGLKVRVFERCI